MKNSISHRRASAAAFVLAAMAVTASLTGCGNGSLRTAQSSGTLSSSSQLGGSAGGALTMSASPAVIPPGGASLLDIDGGVAPYAFTVVGGGAVNATTRQFTAGLSEGTSVITAHDSAGGSYPVTIAVQDTLAISPSTQSLSIGSSVYFSASGGVPPYVFSQTSGVGTFSGQTYMAGNLAGFAQIQVRDSANRVSLANLAVTSTAATLTITPATATLTTGGTVTFNATGGVSPYTFALVSGTGTGTLSGRVFTAGSVATTAQVQVYDAAGAASTATITVQPGSANTPITAAANASADSHVGIAFDGNNTATGPALILYGVGPAVDPGSIGQNVSGCANYGTSFNDLGAPCAVSIPLTNLGAIAYPTTTYKGAVMMTGRTGSTRVEYCIQPAEPKRAYLKVTSSSHSTNLTDEEFFTNIRFSLFGKRLVNGRGTRSHFSKLDTSKAAGPVSIQLQSSGFSTDTSCAGYASDAYVTVDGS